LARVSSVTRSGRFKARDTVIGETPATFETSIKVRLEAFFGTVDDASPAGLPGFFGMKGSGDRENARKGI
jgi:hypothetical protein